MVQEVPGCGMVYTCISLVSVEHTTNVCGSDSVSATYIHCTADMPLDSLTIMQREKCVGIQVL